MTHRPKAKTKLCLYFVSISIISTTAKLIPGEKLCPYGVIMFLSQSVSPLFSQCWRAHPIPSHVWLPQSTGNTSHTNAKRRTDTRWLSAADVERAMKPAWPCMLSLAIWPSQIWPQCTAPPVYLSLALLQHCLWSHLGTLQSLKLLPPDQETDSRQLA